jgi:hypothetical protein
MMSVQPISPRFGAGIVTAAGREHRGFLAPLPSRHIATARGSAGSTPPRPQHDPPQDPQHPRRRHGVRLLPPRRAADAGGAVQGGLALARDKILIGPRRRVVDHVGRRVWPRYRDR